MKRFPENCTPRAVDDSWGYMQPLYRGYVCGTIRANLGIWGRLYVYLNRSFALRIEESTHINNTKQTGRSNTS